LVTDTEDKKNELEAFIYELRGKIDDLYADFADQDTKDKIKDKLEKTEDWLYDEGEDATKAQYQSKIEDIRFLAGPVIQRHLDKIEEERQAILKVQEEAAAKKRAETEAKKKVDDEAKKTAEPQAEEPKDTEMKDAPDSETVKPDSVEEK